MVEIKESADEEIRIIPQLEFHANEMFGLLKDQELNKYTDDEPPVSLSWLANRYKKLESRKSPDGTQFWLNWVIEKRESKRLIGFVQATVINYTATVAWVIGTPFHRNGYATRSARLMLAQLSHMGIRNYLCNIKKGHTASNKVASKLGFTSSKDMNDGEVVWKMANNLLNYFDGEK